MGVASLSSVLFCDQIMSFSVGVNCTLSMTKWKFNDVSKWDEGKI